MAYNDMETKKTAFALSSMQLVTQALAGGRGDTMLALAAQVSGSAGLQPRRIPAVQGVLQRLSQREQEIVRMRYGIDEHIHSVDEISQRLGIMPRQVERIELRAFRKLRDASVGPECSDRPAAPAVPVGRGEGPPLLPAEPRPLPDDSDRGANPWDEV